MSRIRLLAALVCMATPLATVPAHAWGIGIGIGLPVYPYPRPLVYRYPYPYPYYYGAYPYVYAAPAPVIVPSASRRRAASRGCAASAGCPRLPVYRSPRACVPGVGTRAWTAAGNRARFGDDAGEL